MTVHVHERVSGPGPRFAVAVTAEDGRQASGNNGDSLAAVLATVHWEDLDE